MKAVLLFNIVYCIIFYSVYAGIKYDPESRNVLWHKMERYEAFNFHKCSGTINIISSSYYFMCQDNSVRKSNSLKDMKKKSVFSLEANS